MLIKNLILFLSFLATSLIAHLLTPSAILTPPLSKPLNDLTPTSFGDWKTVDTNSLLVDLAPRKDGQPNKFGPYDDSLLRTYKNSQGDIVMLAIAYGRSQRQEVKIHRPELCYVAQGFSIRQLTDVDFGTFGISSSDIYGMDMLAESRGRVEAVSYWIRIGNNYSKSAWQTRLDILKLGLSGYVPDGVLLRVSSYVKDEKFIHNNWVENERFMQELLLNSNAELKRALIR